MAEIPSETLAAFERYAAVAADAAAVDLNDPDVFLNIRTLEERERVAALAHVRGGGTSLRRLRLLDDAGDEIDVPNAWVHHWIGTTFVPSARLEEILAIAQDYDAYARMISNDHLLQATNRVLKNSDGSGGWVLLARSRKSDEGDARVIVEEL